ncbi:MAG: TIGR00730 family Rossman fold protein [Actinobacteria bacterium]|nr:TIGR00730 family Rossman fold protein [Actinomycetota bacterium]MBW3649808.1 TIGR00730 family Rossman fold protein [Actinomycetota bacterium]
MSRRRSPTVTPELAARVEEFLDAIGATQDRDQLGRLLVTVAELARDGTDRLDLKITSAALGEMRGAFRIFAPYREVPKVTIFGSARTSPEDPLYAQTRDVATALSARGWMVITGGGPGIMAAGLEGAGREMSFGINIRLPFEQGANEFIAADPKLVEMKYFFTRKLMLMKESDGFIVLPGGFGTLDETFELLTLIQTGKAEPSPIVLLDVPGGHYWQEWETFVRDQLGTRGLIGEDDCGLYRISDDAGAAVREVTGFYRNYHSRRFVGDVLVVRLRAAPTDGEIDELNDRFGDIVVRGRIERSQPLPPEVHGGDHLEMARIALRFDRIHQGRLRSLIDALNGLESAPEEIAGPAEREVVAGGRPMEPDVRARDDEEEGESQL